MTREECLKVVQAMWKYKDCGYSEYEIREALEIAIRALEQEFCEDAVSRAEVFNILSRNYCSYSVAADGSCVPGNYREGIYDEIKALPSVTPTTKWIPVSERMPNPGEYNGDVDRHYLVQNEYDDMLVARYTKKECWEQIFQIGEIKEKIVAWQPLPKPYKAEMESEE